MIPLKNRVYSHISMLDVAFLTTSVEDLDTRWAITGWWVYRDTTTLVTDEGERIYIDKQDWWKWRQIQKH